MTNCLMRVLGTVASIHDATQARLCQHEPNACDRGHTSRTNCEVCQFSPWRLSQGIWAQPKVTTTTHSKIHFVATRTVTFRYNQRRNQSSSRSAHDCRVGNALVEVLPPQKGIV